MTMKRLQKAVILILLLGLTACESSSFIEPYAAPVDPNENAVNSISVPATSSKPKPLFPSSTPPPSQTAAPIEYHIDAPVISQLPEYYNGCEVTSLAMLTAFIGLPFSKEDLEQRMPKDETEVQEDEDGNILSWGDPRDGFVGDVTGTKNGYSIYNESLAKLLDAVYPAGSLNLSGDDFQEVEKVVGQGKPVVVWSTVDFKPTEDWVTWKTPSGEMFTGTFNVHAVLVTGFDENYVYVNNPLTGEKDQQVEKTGFLESWDQLGRQALTYR